VLKDLWQSEHNKEISIGNLWRVGEGVLEDCCLKIARKYLGRKLFFPLSTFLPNLFKSKPTRCINLSIPFKKILKGRIHTTTGWRGSNFFRIQKINFCHLCLVSRNINCPTLHNQIDMCENILIII